MSGGDGAPGAPTRRILRRGDLARGETRKFALVCSGGEIECFVLNFRGELRAYVNQCRHVAMGLDWVENRFFTADGRFLLCPTHGALYEPETGLCIAGPPCGRSLRPVPLMERDGWIWAGCPAPSEREGGEPTTPARRRSEPG